MILFKIISNKKMNLFNMKVMNFLINVQNQHILLVNKL